jgi:ADP-ribose pyrophosphatase
LTPQPNNLRVLWEGKYLDMMSRGRWEFVRRRGASGVVGIVAVTDDRRLVLVEQYRPPVDRPSIELPAGLAGDIPGAHDESMIVAAKRELLEETGYEAAEMTSLVTGVSSSGLSDESITLMLARGLKKRTAGGGDASENIIVHEVPVGEVHEFLQSQAQQRKAIDFKIYSGLYLFQLAENQGLPTHR